MMELTQVTDIPLSDCLKFNGWGYYSNKGFTPHGVGKKFFNGYYAYGNYVNGKLHGPAIISYDSYMNTIQFKNNSGTGWGLCLDRGNLKAFGYYENSILKVNLTEYVLWYYNKMKQSGRDENMLNMYTFKESHAVADLLIGYKGNQFACFMGFHFVSDGSVWVGTTETRRFDGKLIHFCPNGTIQCGEFCNGELINSLDIQTIIDDYYGTRSFNDDLGLLSERYKNPIREQFRNIEPIVQNYNYFNGLNKSHLHNQSQNKYSMKYFVSEVDFSANGGFNAIDEESWEIGDKFIITPHGTLEVQDAIFVDNGPLVGVQFSVCGSLNISNFKCSQGFENDVDISTFAIMRQPYNVWLWVYAFDKFGNPIINFCGHDELDGLASFIPMLKRIY